MSKQNQFKSKLTVREYVARVQGGSRTSLWRLARMVRQLKSGRRSR